VDFTETMEWITKVFEGVGVAIIALGCAAALVSASYGRATGQSYFDAARRLFGRPLLLGLEVLVAADIVKTVTVDQSLESVAVLGILVLVRIVLSFTLDIELDGRAPWRRAESDQRHETARPAPPEIHS
jgi:uncharacterized membrane protein